MIWELINRLVGNFGYIILIAFIMIKSSIFQKSIKNDIHSKREVLILSIMFSMLGIIGTCLGIPYKGSIVNIRNVSIVISSIICGPFIGGISGTICGIHRFFFEAGSITAVPCSITTILAGILPGLLYKKIDNSNKYVYGILSIISIESLSMILIKIICRLDSEVIAGIYVPMIIINSLGFLLMMTIIEAIFKEMDRIEGEQARITLEIANETLPYFKEVNEDSLKRVCEIIRDSLDAEIAALTDVENILAYSSRNNEAKLVSQKIISNYTKNAIKNKKTIILNDREEKLYFHFDKKNIIKSAIITPLVYDEKVIGTLKVYFNKSSYITAQHKHMVLGLSKMISTQIQIGKIKEYENMANKAEIRSLQSQINPHFLFNALHTIVSFVRVNPDKARELIVNLSDYLRYNLENKAEFIELKDELEQVNSFAAIQEARFPDKFAINYQISEEDKRIKIPPFIIEPLVENSIKHGILKNMTGRNVFIKCIDNDEYKTIVIEDDGCGIDEDIIKKIYDGTINENKVGLYNVHCRVKLIYGKGLKIERLKNGTRISFGIKR